MSRLDIVQPRTGRDGKTYWTKLGSAWPAKNGSGFSLSFEALPTPTLVLDDDGNATGVETRVLLREPLPARDDAAPRQAPARGSRGGFDDDDAPPF